MSTFVATTIKAILSLARQLRRSSISIAIIPILLLLFVGTVGYSLLEGWSLFESLYATVITITTVGYGDFSPSTPFGRIFTIIFTLVAIGLAGYAISTLAVVIIEHQLNRRGRLLEEHRMNAIRQLKDHMIICGAGILGHRVANEFRKRNMPFVLIEEDEETLKWAMLWMHDGYVTKRNRHYHHLDEVDFSEEEDKSVAELADELGILYLMDDPTDEQKLRQAGIERAQGLITALKDDRDNMSVVLSGRDMANRLDNPNLRIISGVLDEWNMHRIYLAGADKVISPNISSGFQIASTMLDPVVGEFWERMLYGKNDDQLVRFSDLPLNENSPWIGQTVAALKQQTSQLVVAIKRDDDYHYAPDGEDLLLQNDILIVMGPQIPTNIR